MKSTDNPHSSWWIKPRGAHIFQKSRSHQKVLGTRRVTHNKFHAEIPQILSATMHNQVAQAT